METQLQEILQKINALQEKIEEVNVLKAEIDRIKASATIPLEVEEAFRDRLNLRDVPIIELSNKSATSENINAVVSVDFGGMSVSTNSVLDNPDVFLSITLGEKTYYVPAFTS